MGAGGAVTRPGAARGGLARRVAWAVLLLGAGALAAVLGRAGSLPVARQGLAAFRTCVLTAYPSTTVVSTDAWVDEANPASNHGPTPDLFLKGTSGARRRIYVRFDLGRCNPAIPSTATVRSAELRLYLDSEPGAAASYAARRVTGPCPEGLAACWGEDTLTWDNQPTVAATATSTVSICADSGCDERYWAWDVAADVAASVAGSASNFGWQLRDAAEGTTSGATVNFFSAENNKAAEAPLLVVVFG